MSSVLKLDFLDVISGNRRRSGFFVDMPLFEAMDKGITRDNLKNIGHIVKVLPNNEYKSGKSIQRENSDPIENYAFQLIDYLKFSNTYDEYKRIFFDSINEYNNKVYKVKYKESLERRNAIDNSFDFL
ncbi:hypothetical protein FJW02_09660 [Pantoea eucalypti]|uniref:Uncharacterized protein n=4 Tax=Pantoea eucalypti TaxID=470933 RepID=A0ABY2ZK37_9GAMM|nr:hypothetical protein FJW02_09660 [Pantoea eucalypti]